MIYIENKKRKPEKIREQYPEADILDITSSSSTRYAQLLSPFYPHGNIPIPFSPGMTAASVEGIWQGLKVFEHYDVDMSSFSNTTMKDLKRTVRKYGNPLGHRKGVHGEELLGYFDARMQIYLPSYKWVLDNIPTVHDIVRRIAERSTTHDVVLLDYNTNDDFRDLSSPMSHAGLLKLYIEGKYPIEGKKYKPLTAEEVKARKEQKKLSKKKTKTSNNNQLNLF
jgi:hypothetical protein